MLALTARCCRWTGEVVLSALEPHCGSTSIVAIAFYRESGLELAASVPRVFSSTQMRMNTNDYKRYILWEGSIRAEGAVVEPS